MRHKSLHMGNNAFALYVRFSYFIKLISGSIYRNIITANNWTMLYYGEMNNDFPICK